MLFNLFDLFLIQILIQIGKFSLFNSLGSTNDLGDVVKDWGVELKICLFDFSDGLSHLVFNFSDFFVSFVDSNSFDFFRKWEFLNTCLNVLSSDFTLTLE